MLRACVLLGLGALPVSADVTGPGGEVVDCYCTDARGGRVDLGEEICLYVDGRAFMARCEMALNNPIWRDTGRGCMSSERAQPRQPALDPGTVDPKV